MSPTRHDCIPSKIIYRTENNCRCPSSLDSVVGSSKCNCCSQYQAGPNTGSFQSTPDTISSPWHTPSTLSPCTSPRHRSRSPSPTVPSSVSKLGYLADECSRLSASVGSVVSQSSQILDNHFLSTQEHLIDHVVTLNYKACWDIATAIGTYEEYVFTMEEMVEALDKEEKDIFDKWKDLDALAKQLFMKVENREQNTHMNETN